MATFSQFIGNPKMLRVVVFAAGRDEALVRTTVNEVEHRVQPDYVRRIDASSVTTTGLLEQLAEPSLFGDREMVVYGDVTQRHDLRPLIQYAKRPLEDTTVVLTAGSPKRADGERWIPSKTNEKAVLYVDCNTASEAALRAMCGRLGLTGGDTDHLLHYAAGEPSEIVRILDLCGVFERPWPEGLVRDVTPPAGKKGNVFEAYALLPTTSDHVLAQRLMERTVKMAMIGSLDAKLGTREISQRVELEPFIVKRLETRAREDTPERWIERTARIARHARYAGQPRFEEFLRCCLA